MTIESSNSVRVSAAGTHLPQTTGADLERVRQDIARVERQNVAGQQAAHAAGIAAADGQNHAASDRDADGRRAWQIVLPSIANSDRDAIPSTPGRDAADGRGQAVDLIA